jgi:hypothetical protein
MTLFRFQLDDDISEPVQSLDTCCIVHGTEYAHSASAVINLVVVRSIPPYNTSLL